MRAEPTRLRLGYLYGGEVRYQPGEQLALRQLTDYELVYVISGTVRYTCDGETYAVPPGGIILGREGSSEKYKWDATKETRHAFFHFRVDQLPADWPDPSNWPRFQPEPDPVVVSLFRHVMVHINEHGDWPAVAPGERDCLLVETLIDSYLESHETSVRQFERERPEPVRRALKWMRQQIDDQPNYWFTLADMARAAGCTPKYLCRVFKQSVGYSPAKTGTFMRLQLSLVLLTRSNLTIGEVAAKCGFDNPLYFSRCFRKAFGRPPTAVRSDLANGIPPPSAPLPADITPRVHW